MNSLHENLTLSLQEAEKFAGRCAKEASHIDDAYNYTRIQEELAHLIYWASRFPEAE